MKKIFALLIFVLVISCNYKTPEKDRHPEIPVFSEQVLQNPEKYGLIPINESKEDIEGLFLDNERLIMVGTFGKPGISPDSIVISEYKNFLIAKKIYYKIEQDSTKPTLNLYQIDYLDGKIYSTNYKFSVPDYKPVILDSAFLKKRKEIKFKTNFADVYNSENVLKPFDEIVIANSTQCGGGKLGTLICPVYLSYFKINSKPKNFLFKERESNNKFKILSIFGKKYLFYNASYNGNSQLFLVNEK